MSILDTIDDHPHHARLEEVVQILCTMTQNTQPQWFRIVAAHFFAKMAASMRAAVNMPIATETNPVNVYAIAMANSGFGKGHSINILERQLLAGFEKRYKQDAFPVIAEQNVWRMAIERAAVTGETEDTEFTKLSNQFMRCGPIPFTFDSGTPAAVKQVRDKLLIAGIGAINLQVDEIGSHLVNQTEILNVFLELFDQGHTKMKLVKSTAENERNEELDGKTPTNALLFGTPAKLLDGASTEDAFYSFLETGFARRCLFGFGDKDKSAIRMTPAERFKQLTQQNQTKAHQSLASHFTQLADPAKYGWEMTTDQAVTEAWLEYQDVCRDKAEKFATHEDIKRAEMEHRHSKAIKLAGALAFVDESLEVTMHHLLCAIKIVEESGIAFQRLLNREPAYVKLAKYLAEVDTEQTHADLHQNLPFYTTSTTRRNELMRDATAWGYKNNVIIRKTFEDSIEFFSGETLKETDLEKMILSYSDHQAYGYTADTAPFEKLHLLTQAKDMHWCNHQFVNNHRLEDHAIPGFNMLVFDVDGNAKLDFVHEALAEYTFLTSTTKRHTPDEHRFRLILPISFMLELDQEDYFSFVNNVLMWLPFESDDTARQRSKKWLSNDQGTYHYNEGHLLNPLRFIPKTSKNEQYVRDMRELGSLDNLERWFAQRMFTDVNRNNQMIKFALTLVDTGMSFAEVENAVLSFNSKLSNKLEEEEIRNTILVTVARKIHSAP